MATPIQSPLTQGLFLSVWLIGATLHTWELPHLPAMVPCGNAVSDFLDLAAAWAETSEVHPPLKVVSLVVVWRRGGERQRYLFTSPISKFPSQSGESNHQSFNQILLFQPSGYNRQLLTMPSAASSSPPQPPPSPPMLTQLPCQSRVRGSSWGSRGVHLRAGLGGGSLSA